jgi:hypothetical protein
LNKVNELDGKVDIVFVDGKIAANRGAMLIIKVKRVNSNIKTESVVDKIYSMLATRSIIHILCDLTFLNSYGS